MPPDRQIDQLLGGILGGERAPRLDRFPDHPVQALNRVRGIDHPADFRAEGEERNHLLPGPAPGLGDRGILPAPDLIEGLQRVPGRLGGLGAVDLAQLGRDRLAVLPGAEVQRMANEVHDAG